MYNIKSGKLKDAMNLKHIFPLSFKPNMKNPKTLVFICFVYIVSCYLVRFLLSLIPFFKFGFNIVSALFTLYVFIGLTIALLRYLRKD